MTELHGKLRSASVESYTSPEEYSGQGDDRIVRDLIFSYTVATQDAAGNPLIAAVDASRHTKLSIEDMGLIALEKGERLHSFYTDEERSVFEAGGDPSRPQRISDTATPSEMGEYELAEYIKGSNPQGKALNVQETVDLAGSDKDLAHRLLQAENIASEGDPRTGVERGLTAIIESGD